MELKDYEKKIGRSVGEMTYEELLGYLEINKDSSDKFSLSYDEAYWLKRLYEEKRITEDEYSYGLDVLREAIKTSSEFCRRFVEAEDPTGKVKDHWMFYIED